MTNSPLNDPVETQLSESRSKNPFKATAQAYQEVKTRRKPISEEAMSQKLDSVGNGVAKVLSVGNILNFALIAGTIAVSVYGANLNSADQAVLSEQREKISTLDSQNSRLSATYSDLSSADNSKEAMTAIRQKAQAIADTQMKFITADLSQMPALKREIHDLFVDSSYHLGSTISPDGPYFFASVGPEPALTITVAQPVYEENGTWSVNLTLKDEAEDIYGWATLTYSPLDQKFTEVRSQLTGYGQKIIDDMHAKALEKGFGSHYEGLEGVATAEPSEESSAEPTSEPSAPEETPTEQPAEESSEGANA